MEKEKKKKSNVISCTREKEGTVKTFLLCLFIPLNTFPGYISLQNLLNFLHFNLNFC